MSVKRAIATIATIATLVVGGAATASADSAETYSAPRGVKCGTMLAVTVTGAGTAVFRYAECDRIRQGDSTGPARTFEAPERTKCGPLLTLRVTRDVALFRYAECDRRVVTTGATE